VPHAIHQRKFGRKSDLRRSMLRNLTLSVLRYERVKTTEAKAKEIRGFVDRMINLGKDGGVEARRKVAAWLPEQPIVEKVFTDLAKRYPGRTGGYLRMTRLSRRVGDNSKLMMLELMPGDDEVARTEKAAEEEKPRRRRLALPRRGAAKAETKDDEAKPAKSTAKKTAPKKKSTAKA
jgi:large subunit ribosomal protein L17